MFSSPTLRTFVAEAEANHELEEWHGANADKDEVELSARERWEQRMLEESLRNIRESRRELEELGVSIRPIDTADHDSNLDGTAHNACTNGEEKKTADESPPRVCRSRSKSDAFRDEPNNSSSGDQDEPTNSSADGRRFVPTKTLGTGAFSTVHLATHHMTGCTVALKVMSKSQIAALAAEMETINREIQNLRLCSGHAHIIKLYDVIDAPESMELVMEHASGGELKDYVMAKTSRVASPGGEGLPPDEARQFFQQLISGIEYMHSRGVIHRDLKMENLLLDAAKSRIKIVDFGLSKRVNVSGGEMLKTACGSPRHAAPEVMSANLPNGSSKPYRGPPVDVWSAGVVLYAMLTAQLPFRGDDVDDILPKVIKGEYWMPPFLTWGVRQLIEGMMCVEVNERLTVGKIREDEWFKRDLPDYLGPEKMEEDECRTTVDAKVVEEVVRRYNNKRGGSKVTGEMVELAAKDVLGGDEMGAEEEKDDIKLRDLRVAYRLVLDEDRSKKQSSAEGSEASSVDGGCKDDDNMLFLPSCPCDDNGALRVPWSRT